MTAPAPGSPDEAASRPVPHVLTGGSRDADDFPIDVDLIKVLASDTRRDILRHLGERRKTLSELAEACGLKKATIIEHLEKLVAAGLIRRIDDGERIWIYYELTPRGVRIVRPGRSTRFYLLMGASAVALVLVGAFVAAAMLGGIGAGPMADEPGMRDERTALADGAGERRSVLVWQGFDDNVAIDISPAPAGASVSIAGETLPVEDSRIVLTGLQIDAFPLGQHTLVLHSEAGDLTLPITLDARAPPIALAPLVVPAGVPTSLALSVGDPDLPSPTNVTAHALGKMFSLGAGRERTIALTPHAVGPVDVQVGRLARLTVLAVPDVRVAVDLDNGTATFRAHVGDVPLRNATLALDGDELGRTDERGILRVAAPAPGEHVLRVGLPDGGNDTRALLFHEHAVEDAPAQVSLSAYGGPPGGEFIGHVDIANAGAAPELVSIVASMNGSAIASAIVEVPARGAAQATLRAPVPLTSEVKIDAFVARPIAPARFDAYAAYEERGNVSSNGQPHPPQAAAFAYDADRPSSFRLLLGPDASTVIHPVRSPTWEGSADAHASAVPFPPLVLVLAVALAVALAMRARRREP